MKKILIAALSALFLITAVFGCGKNQAENNSKNQTDSEKIKVVTTIFPVYDWTREIAGDNANVTFLLDKGVDLHSFQPTASDIMKISDADIFIYVGGESDEWVEDVLKEAKNKNMIKINLMETLGDKVKVEEYVEGMEKHEHKHEDKHEHDEDKPEYDEHIWLSLKNAQILTDAIEKALAKKDPKNADKYKKNLDNYQEKLKKLDNEYQTALSNTKNKTLLFGDRFPFRYLLNDYGISYYAAFSGCSAETEASFETIAFLSNKLNDLKLPAIMCNAGRTHKIPEIIIENVKEQKPEILTLDTMEGTSGKDAQNGATYLSVMKKNLDVFKEALK